MTLQNMFVFLCACAFLHLCYLHILPEYHAIRGHTNNALNYFLTISNNNVVGAQMCDVVAIPSVAYTAVLKCCDICFFFSCGAATQRGSWPPHS
jgi:hypothetical protein